MVKILISAINFYRNYLSGLKLPCCRYYPPCSQYFIDALKKYGFFVGMFKSVGRIIRCNPFSRGGYDQA